MSNAARTFDLRLPLRRPHRRRQDVAAAGLRAKGHLATNVAETSVTIEASRVIDSGPAASRATAWSESSPGDQPVSRASCTQRGSRTARGPAVSCASTRSTITTRAGVRAPDRARLAGATRAPRRGLAASALRWFEPPPEAPRAGESRSSDSGAIRVARSMSWARMLRSRSTRAWGA
jgi:hypothetical protein